LDSFADFVSFGIAPAALVFFRLEPHSARPGLLAGLAGLYVLALAIRLARFNITTGQETVFFGIPGTMMGAVIASSFLTLSKYHFDALFAYLPVLLLVGALTMVSNIRLPKLKARKSKVMNILQFGNVAIAYLFGPLMLFPEYLLSLALVYLVGGIGYCLANPQAEKPAAAGEARDPDERLAA
jgi:CDP-diacylglycerol--serine O-phosphatidyltransferase